MERLLSGVNEGSFRSIDVEQQENIQQQILPAASCLNNKCKDVAVKNLKAFGLAVYFSFIFFAWGGVLRGSCVNHNKKYGGDEELRLNDCKIANNLFIIGSVFLRLFI